MYNRNNELVLIILNVKLIIPTAQRRKIVSEATVITTAYNITVVHTYYYLSPLLEILPISTNTTFMKTHIYMYMYPRPPACTQYYMYSIHLISTSVATQLPYMHYLHQQPSGMYNTPTKTCLLHEYS